MVGCETAAHLARMGKQVTLVEMREDVALDAEVFYQTAVKIDMEKKHVEIMTNTSGVEINAKGLIVEQKGEKKLIPADMILNAVGYYADNMLFEKLHDAAPMVHRIGDCRRPGKVFDAISTGYYVAMDL